jgi:hypothetical protein
MKDVVKEERQRAFEAGKTKGGQKIDANEKSDFWEGENVAYLRKPLPSGWRRTPWRAAFGEDKEGQGKI